MMKMLSFLIPIWFATMLFCTTTKAEDPRQVQYQAVLELRKSFRYAEALQKALPLLKADSSNLEYLSQVSYLLAIQAYPGQPENRKESQYQLSRKLAERALSINNKQPELYYNLALALGRLSEHASVSTKIENAKQIRIAAEKAIELNGSLAGPHHILGRWHREIAGFNAFEMAMIGTFFGKGLEGGTYESAIFHFQKAIQLEPDNLMHYFELANTYAERDRGKDENIARQYYQKVLTLMPRTEDEKRTQNTTRSILK
jgi:tetratricopeptide (TPR) repeat protein